MSGGMPGQGGKPGKRGVVGGWSLGSAARNARWLQSVSPPLGLGIAVTLTLKDPVTSVSWRDLLRTYIRMLSKHPRIEAFHYVVEWQARGVPHLHVCCYVDAEPSAWPTYMVMLRRYWVSISANADMHAQYAKAISSYVGWLEYVAKHGARGMYHYQRGAVPEGWQGASSGKMWGYGGNWPGRAEGHLNLSKTDYARFSRVVRRYMISIGRPRKVIRKVFDKTRGFPRGLMEWVPISVSLPLLDWLVSFPDSDVSWVEKAGPSRASRPVATEPC